MKLPWLFIESSPKNAKERETGGMELVSVRQDGGLQLRFHWQDAHPVALHAIPESSIRSAIVHSASLVDLRLI